MPLQPLAPGDPTAAGEFRLSARLGLGGMGQVFLGYSPAGRAVAVKICHPELAADPAFVERFARETTAAQAVNGLYTAQVMGAGPYDRPPWMATAYVPGPSLSEYVHGYGPLPEAAAWRLAAGLAEALLAVHACGLVHRDLKPSNVLLAVDGPRVIDFGIASALEATGLTTAGSVLGSPPYMSPEQAMGEPTGPASDVFAFGATLAFAVSGAPPFGEGEAPAVLFRVAHTAPELDRLPPGLRALVAACLDKDPAARPSLPQVLRGSQDATAGYPGSAASFWPGPMTAAIAAQAAAQGRAAAEPGLPQPSGVAAGGSGGYHPPTVASASAGALAGPGQSGPSGSLLGRRRLLLAGVGGVVVAGGLAAGGWALTRPNRPGAAAPPSRVAWTRATGGPVRSIPALSGDGQTLYVASDDGTLYELDAATGRPANTFPVGGKVSGVSVNGTTVLAGGADGKVYAFAGGNEGSSWTYPTGGAIAGAPVAGAGVVCAGSADGYLYGLDFSTGKRKWRTATGGGPAVPGVPDGIGQVWAGGQDGSVYVLHASDGTAAVTPFAAGGPVTAAPVEFTATVYIASGASGGRGMLNSLSFDEDLDKAVNVYWRFPADAPIQGTPVHSEEAIYTATTAGTVYGLAVSTSDPSGNQLWVRHLGGAVRGGPTVHNGTLYVGCDDGNLYAIDLSDGSVNWSYRTGAPVQSRIVTANGLVYFGCLDHKVYALRA